VDRIGAVLVDTYRIERLIAEGGMGAVYEASHLRIPKKFAVKFLKVSLLENTVALLRFRREAEVIATIDHPHVVSLLDYNMTEDGVPYTVLEYLEGEHLGDRVNRGRLPLVEAMRVAEAVAGALSAAHAKGVVHRDLKPENVILCTRGAIKVVDFGIAKLRGGQDLTAFNSILGTVTYMAPEQLMAGPIDARADQFALGAMVYEMLSGEMPFGSDGTIPQIAERVLRQQPPPIGGYPATIYEVVLKAMAKEAAQRYADVSAFQDALRGLLPILESAGAADRTATAQAAAPPLAADVAQLTVADDGLPELPGEATSIASSPTFLATPDDPTTDAPAETTRITRGVPLPPDPRGAGVTLRPGQLAPVRHVEVVTGRMTPFRLGGVQLGQRGGIVVGVVIGVVMAVLANLLMR
jgi:eukaryotic-like serine/threonine-protein kinase